MNTTRAAIESIRRDGASALMNIQEDVSLQLARYLRCSHVHVHHCSCNHFPTC